MQLVFGAVQNAMSDPESVLSRAVHAALKVGVGKPARWLFGSASDLLGATEAAAELGETAEAAALQQGAHASEAAKQRADA